MATLGKLIQLVWLIITLFQPHQSGFIYDHEFFFFKHISLGDQLELGCESKLAAVPAIWEANESTDLEKIIYHLQAPVSSSVNWGQWYLPLRFPITPCCSLSWGINTSSWDLPGGPVAKTPCSQCRSPEFDSWSGN